MTFIEVQCSDFFIFESSNTIVTTTFIKTGT